MTAAKKSGRVTVEVITDPWDLHGVSDAVAENIREARKRRGWNTADLAARCGENGWPGLSQNIIENVESGRRKGGERTRDVTVDELVAFAYALGLPPAALFPELGDSFADMDASLFRGIDDMVARLQDLKEIATRLRKEGGN